VKHTITILLLAIVQITYGQKMLMFKEAKIPYPKVTDKLVSDWNSQQKDFAKLSNQEQEFYYWVNYSRLNPRLFFDSVVVPVSEVYPQLKGSNYQSLYNDVNRISSLPLLNLNDGLIKMAKAHALDIVSHDAKPSHNSTDGQTFSDRFKQKNFKYCGGENISFGGGEPIFLLVLLYLDINVPELGHRKALLNPNYTETGIGVANYSNGNIFLVEDFSCRQN
jgi:hypothetical protein